MPASSQRTVRPHDAGELPSTAQACERISPIRTRICTAPAYRADPLVSSTPMKAPGRVTNPTVQGDPVQGDDSAEQGGRQHRGDPGGDGQREPCSRSARFGASRAGVGRGAEHDQQHEDRRPHMPHRRGQDHCDQAQLHHRPPGRGGYCGRRSQPCEPVDQSRDDDHRHAQQDQAEAGIDGHDVSSPRGPRDHTGGHTHGDQPRSLAGFVGFRLVSAPERAPPRAVSGQ